MNWTATIIVAMLCGVLSYWGSAIRNELRACLRQLERKNTFDTRKNDLEKVNQ